MHDEAVLERELVANREALVHFCRRRLGSRPEAEDAVQETMVRAWRGYAGFEGRASVRTWLYAIATRVCLSMAAHRGRNPFPVDLDAVGAAAGPPSAPVPTLPWILAAGHPSRGADGDPAELVESRTEVRIALAVAVARLTPLQRAVLVLREVLAWHAREVAELLDTSVASVNSALQRARATLATADVGGATAPLFPVDPDQARLLAGYVDALERADVTRLVSLLRHEACAETPAVA